MTAEEPRPLPKSRQEYEREFTKLEWRLAAAEKRQTELKTEYIDAKKHIRHLQHDRRNLLDVIVLKTKKVEDLLLSSDEDEDLLQGPGIGDLKALTGASSKAPGSAIGKASTTGKKATPAPKAQVPVSKITFVNSGMPPIKAEASASNYGASGVMSAYMDDVDEIAM